MAGEHTKYHIFNRFTICLGPRAMIPTMKLLKNKLLWFFEKLLHLVVFQEKFADPCPTRYTLDQTDVLLKSKLSFDFQLNRSENAGNKPCYPKLTLWGSFSWKHVKFTSGYSNPSLVSSFSSIGVKMQEISFVIPNWPSEVHFRGSNSNLCHESHILLIIFKDLLSYWLKVVGLYNNNFIVHENRAVHCNIKNDPNAIS